MAKPGRADVEQEVGEWVAEYGDRLVQYAWALVRDREEAQDVAQEAFRLLYRWHAGPGAARPMTPALLYRIAQRVALDRLRQRPTRPLPRDSAAEPAPLWDAQGDLRLDVELVLAEIAWSDRAALRLFYCDGWTTEDIARHLGVTRVNVRGRLFRARQRFMKIWRARDVEEDSAPEGVGRRDARDAWEGEGPDAPSAERPVGDRGRRRRVARRGRRGAAAAVDL